VGVYVQYLHVVVRVSSVITIQNTSQGANTLINLVSLGNRGQVFFNLLFT
jgi:hypothetical protein